VLTGLLTFKLAQVFFGFAARGVTLTGAPVGRSSGWLKFQRTERKSQSLLETLFEGEEE